jgi:anhydro-N-acetylmuramic acid kinase
MQDLASDCFDAITAKMGTASRLFAGAMSGTSADGVDVALVRITGRGLDMSASLLHHHAHLFDSSLKNKIFAIREGQSIAMRHLVVLGRDLAMAYAAAVNDALLATNLRASDLTAIAAHGQTLFHDPPLTLQWLDPALLAERTRCTVVSDFRRADCAAGGQGAPLVPFADYVLFRDPAVNRVLLNIGGIANLTFIPAGGTIEDVVAFDTGPGNCISDFLCRQADPAGLGYDKDGTRAGRGKPDPDFVSTVCRHDFFTKAPPKSTDVPTMIELFQSTRLSIGGAFWTDDLLASACLITAGTILEAFRKFVGDLPAQWIVSGGGSSNQTIMELLRRAVGDLIRADDLGVPSAAKEALAFALLGAATLDGEPANLPRVTGASRPVVLGAITPRP